MTPALSVAQGVIFVTIPALVSIAMSIFVKPVANLLPLLLSQAAALIYLLVTTASQSSSSDLKWALQAIVGFLSIILRVFVLLLTQGCGKPDVRNTSDDEEQHWCAHDRDPQHKHWDYDRTSSFADRSRSTNRTGSFADRSGSTVPSSPDIEARGLPLDASETVPRMSLSTWALALLRS